MFCQFANSINRATGLHINKIKTNKLRRTKTATGQSSYKKQGKNVNTISNTNNTKYVQAVHYLTEIATLGHEDYAVLGTLLSGTALH